MQYVTYFITLFLYDEYFIEVHLFSTPESILGCCFGELTNMRPKSDVGWMLGQRYRRWSNIL